MAVERDGIKRVLSSNISDVTQERNLLNVLLLDATNPFLLAAAASDIL